MTLNGFKTLMLFEKEKQFVSKVCYSSVLFVLGDIYLTSLMSMLGKAFHREDSELYVSEVSQGEKSYIINKRGRKETGKELLFIAA